MNFIKGSASAEGADTFLSNHHFSNPSIEPINIITFVFWIVIIPLENQSTREITEDCFSQIIIFQSLL
jgi:hypothetical protein